jgi:hypothetical protein
MMHSVTPEAKAAQSEEDRRLLAMFEGFRAQELAAAHELAHPRHSILYPAYKRLEAALTALRLKCDKVRLAIRAHRNKMRNGAE